MRLFIAIIALAGFAASCRDHCTPDRVLNKEMSEIGDCLKDSVGSVEYFYSKHMEHFYEYGMSSMC